jgi:hypothetical protein
VPAGDKATPGTDHYAVGPKSGRRAQSKILVMSRVEELESQIMGLLPEEFRELRAWVAEHDAEVWDRQFDKDVRAGRLDAIADQALRDFSEYRASDL